MARMEFFEPSTGSKIFLKPTMARPPLWVSFNLILNCDAYLFCARLHPANDQNLRLLTVCCQSEICTYYTSRNINDLSQ